MEDTREDLKRAAIRLLNQGGFRVATVASICAEVGVDEGDFARFYTSEDDLFNSITESLMREHAEAIGRTLLRRRSLTESMRVALFAFWSVVEEQADVHQATNYLTFGSLRGSDSKGQAGRTLYSTYLVETQQQLREMEQIHGITWELPITRLARLVLATLDGLIHDYLINRDSAAVKEILELFAYQVAQHGRRVAKNDPK